MSKRPSLADTMRQAAQTEPLFHTPAHQRTSIPNAVGKFHAATRVGKKKVTANLTPPTHKLLKTLAVQRETTTEALLSEAISDLLNKYNIA
jgi:hypothetical protein